MVSQRLGANVSVAKDISSAINKSQTFLKIVLRHSNYLQAHALHVSRRLSKARAATHKRATNQPISAADAPLWVSGDRAATLI